MGWARLDFSGIARGWAGPNEVGQAEKLAGADLYWEPGNGDEHVADV